VLGRSVCKLDEQYVVRILVRLAIPPLPRVLCIWCLSELLKHIFTTLQDIARSPILDGLECTPVGCAPVSHGKRVTLDWLDGSPDGVRGVALGFSMVVFGIESLLCGGCDILTAITSRTFQAAESVVTVSETGWLQAGVLPTIYFKTYKLLDIKRG
jgi:hypothetical protein